MKKYLIIYPNQYSVRFYLIDESQKELILKTKSLSSISDINILPCFKQIKDLLDYLTTQDFILGKEEFVAYSSDVVVNN